MSAAAGSVAAAARGGGAWSAALARRASLAGLPLLVALIYTNASDVAIRGLGFPSLLQPLIALLAVAAFAARRDLLAGELWQPLTAALAAWCLVVFAGTIYARDLALADARAAETAKGLVMSLLVACLAASWRALRLAVTAIVASGSALALLTLAQAVSGTSSEFLGFARGQSSSIYGDVVQVRASGPVGDPNFFAQILLMAIPLAVFGAIAASRRTVRGAAVVAAALLLAAMLLTYSRGGMVALLVMLVLTLAAIRIRARHAITAVTVAVAIALLLFVLPIGSARRLRTVESLLTQPSVDQDSSIEKRKLLLRASWSMFRDHPLAGVGSGNFSRSFDRYRNEVGFASTLYEARGARHFPHNLYFEVAAENGLAGITTFGAAVLVAFTALRSARHRLEAAGEPRLAALAAGVAVSLAGYLASSLFLHAAFQRYLWLLFGLAIAVIRLAGRAPAARAGDSR